MKRQPEVSSAMLPQSRGGAPALQSGLPKALTRQHATTRTGSERQSVGGSRVRLLAMNAPAPSHAALRRILWNDRSQETIVMKRCKRVLTGKSGPCHQSEPNVAAPTISLKSPTAEPTRQVKRFRRHHPKAKRQVESRTEENAGVVGVESSRRIVVRRHPLPLHCDDSLDARRLGHLTAQQRPHVQRLSSSITDERLAFGNG